MKHRPVNNPDTIIYTSLEYNHPFLSHQYLILKSFKLLRFTLHIQNMTFILHHYFNLVYHLNDSLPEAFNPNTPPVPPHIPLISKHFIKSSTIEVFFLSPTLLKHLILWNKVLLHYINWSFMVKLVITIKFYINLTSAPGMCVREIYAPHPLHFIYHTWCFSLTISNNLIWKENSI